MEDKKQVSLAEIMMVPIVRSAHEVAGLVNLSPEQANLSGTRRTHMGKNRDAASNSLSA